jgi:DNA-binding transcriptional LysR family regulator
MDQFDLNEIAIFVKVVDAGSFTGAAKALNLPKSTVSRKITQLEEHLGVRLLQRTTRTLSLTDTGSAYYNQCARIIADVREANVAVTQMQSSPTGLLRITAPVLFGSRVLSEVVAEFLLEHPQIQLDMVLTDQPLDLIQDGIDVAFRVGALADSSLIARTLGEVSAMLCASPEYLAKHGKPNHPNDLKQHQVLSYGTQAEWEFSGAENITVSMRPRIHVNDFESLKKFVLKGFGIAAIPAIVCADEVRNGELQPLLCEWPFNAFPIHALYPSNRHLSVKVRSFVDFVVERLRANPPWVVDLDGVGCDKC